MANPDITPYVDLTLFDRDPQQVFELALTILQLKRPEWTPREGNQEVLLTEAMALECAELIYAINRVPDAVLEALLKLYGIIFDDGAVPVTTVQFNMSGTTGYTIPAGTALRLDLGGGLDAVTFTTDVELTIPIGDAEGAVAATGDTNTADVNGITAGQEVELLDSLVYVDSVIIATDILGGRDPETDAQYFDRAVQRLDRLSDALVLPRHFTAFALEDPAVNRAYTIDNYNPASDPDNNGPVGNDGGHVTVALYGDNANLTAGEKSAVLADMQELALANLAIHVIDPIITVVPVTVSVYKDKGYDDATVIANVNAALTEFLDRNNWDWSTKVRRTQLIQVIGNAEGVAYVDVLTAPAADVVLPAVANLTTPGALAVTVTG